MRFQTARWDHGIILLLLLLFIWFFFSFLYFLHLHGWLMAHVIFSQTNTKCYTNAKCLLWIVNFDIFVFSFHIMYNNELNTAVGANKMKMKTKTNGKISFEQQHWDWQGNLHIYSVVFSAHIKYYYIPWF